MIKTIDSFILHQNYFDFWKFSFVSKIQFFFTYSVFNWSNVGYVTTKCFFNINLFFQLLICCFKTILGKMFWFEFYKRRAISYFKSSLAIQIAYCFQEFLWGFQVSMFLKVFLRNFWKCLCWFHFGLGIEVLSSDAVVGDAIWIP